MYANGLKVNNANINLPNKYNYNLILLFVKKNYVFLYINQKPTVLSLIIWHQSFLLRVSTQVLIFEREWWLFLLKKELIWILIPIHHAYQIWEYERWEACLCPCQAQGSQSRRRKGEGRKQLPKPWRAWEYAE